MANCDSLKLNNWHYHNDFLNFDAELYAILNDMLDLDLGGNYYWNYCGKILVMFRPVCSIAWSPHSDLNDQNSFHAPKGGRGGINLDDQIEVQSGKLER